MKKYLKKSFAVLTCTTMCIQTTMAILAEKIPGSDTSQQISIQALTTGQFRINEKLQWTQQTKVPITREKKSKHLHLSALLLTDIISVFQKNQSIFFSSLFAQSAISIVFTMYTLVSHTDSSD